MTSNSGGGRRIKLDLSNFVSDGGARRWMWLSRDQVASVSDLVDQLRSEYHQLGDQDLVTLTLDSFVLPHWESVDILQSGE